jgi:hypothetical protein
MEVALAYFKVPWVHWCWGGGELSETARNFRMVAFRAETRTLYLPNTSRILSRDSNHAPSKYESYFVPRFEPCTAQIQVILHRGSKHVPSKYVILRRDSNHAPSKYRSYFASRFEPHTVQIQVFCCKIRTMHRPHTSHILLQVSNHAPSKNKLFCAGIRTCTFQIRVVSCAEIRTRHLPHTGQKPYCLSQISEYNFCINFVSPKLR